MPAWVLPGGRSPTPSRPGGSSGHRGVRQSAAVARFHTTGLADAARRIQQRRPAGRSPGVPDAPGAASCRTSGSRRLAGGEPLEAARGGHASLGQAAASHAAVSDVAAPAVLECRSTGSTSWWLCTLNIRNSRGLWLFRCATRGGRPAPAAHGAPAASAAGAGWRGPAGGC